MSDIPLRTYVEQLDNLIGRKQVDEAIAHCRHILGIYPKHLDTYRMLGKALLEKGRHGDAADIFQRVLSVMPDDFISHVGMSIVREDEANLDAAIWHMERAFEAAPSNGAIQQELCRLYGRRDGVVPAKARLTRGALARMYVQGGLYLQAEAELKAALSDSADRIDLLTILAEVYWQTEQPAQAAQTSAAILQKLPYSLEANRILVNIFRGQGRADDAAIYRQRLEALDPYEAFADSAANGAGTARVEASKVMVSRLDYVAGMEDSGSPDWLASIGAKFEEPAATAHGSESQPDWLTAAGEAAKSPGVGSFPPGAPDVPDWLKELGSTSAASATPDRPASTTGASDWLTDLGLGTAPLAPLSEPADAGLPDWLVAATGPLPPDAVPDWMLTEPGASATPPTEPVTAPLGPASQSLEWMQAVPPPAPGAAGARQPVAAEPGHGGALGPDAPSDDLPEWLKNELPQEGEDDLPDWLKAMTAGPLPATDRPPTIAKPAGLAAADIPDWLKGAAPTEAVPAAPVSPAAGLVPDWLQSAARDPLGTGPLPDWLKVATGELDPRKAAGIGEPTPASAKLEQTASAPPAASADASQSVALEAQPREPAQPISAAPATDMPAWMRTGGVADTGAAGVPAGPTAGAANSADNLASHGAATNTSIPEPAPALPPATEPLVGATQLRHWLDASAPVDDPHQADPKGSAAESAEELPDWLQSATGEASGETMPAWLRSAPVMPTLASAGRGEESELELPAWLRSLGAGAPPPVEGRVGAAEGKQDVANAAARVELPDYLQMASPGAIARAEHPFEPEPEEATLAAEDAGAVAALPADIPDWLKALAPASAEPIAAPIQPPMSSEALAPADSTLDQSLNWLDELTAQSDVTSIPAAGPVSAEAASQPEFSANAEADTLSGLGADLPPWAQTQEPGPTDTIASWLAGKHVPDWLRQPVDEAPTLPAVDWEPAAEPAEPALEPVMSAVEPASAAPPGLDSADPDETFRWLEQLAARQGAPRDELLTLPEAVTASIPAPASPAESIAGIAAAASSEALISRLPATDTELAAVPVPGPEAEGTSDWLRATEAAMPAEPLLDTAPSKAQRPSATAPEASPASPVEAPAENAAQFALPLSATPELSSPTAPESSDLEADAAMRWLEGLAAQQGANPEELLSAPEERPTELPSWIAAEQVAARAETPSQTDQPVPVHVELTAPAVDEAASAELPALATVREAAGPIAEATLAEVPVAEASHADVPLAVPPTAIMPAEAGPDIAAFDDDEAQRWLEGLAAQQGAKSEELLTAPEDRPVETPAWITAEQLATHSEAETNVASTFKAAPAELEPETAGAPEPEPDRDLEPPAWLKSLGSAGEGAAGSVEDTKPPVLPAGPDFDKLARLAERLAAARHAREVELEARFAEQRAQQEAARRDLEEKLEAKRLATQPPSATEAEPVARLEPLPPTAPLSEMAAPAVETPPFEPSSAAGQRRSRPSIRVRPQHTAPLRDTGPAAEALAHGRAALSAKDYDAAVIALSALVEHNQHVELVMGALETVAAGARPPAPVLRLLGDTYMRTDQLQKALDTYRLALSSL